MSIQQNRTTLDPLALPTTRPNQMDPEDTGKMAMEMFADLEATLSKVAQTNPRVEDDGEGATRRTADLKALLEISIAINSSLVLDDVLRLVMEKAIELMQAERGLIMLLDSNGELQMKSAYNLCKEQMMEEDFRISSSITSQVARTGKPVYTSDAMADDRYAHQKSVVELHLRSIMCVPLHVQGQVIGVIYLDNSNQAKMFLKSDLYLFELYAQLVSNALHNAHIYESLLRMEKYNESVVVKSPVGIVVIDSQGRMATINPVALEIFDLNRDRINLIGQSTKPTVFVDLLPDQQRTRWQRMLNTVLTTKQEFADRRYFHNTGYLEKVLSLKISPLQALPNDYDGIVMTVQDITEEVTMEQYVILSEKLVARGEMAASVAHELNNFLSIISNNAELLAINLDRGNTEKVKFNSKSITENVFKIKRFVDSLMDFSRQESEFISYDVKHLIDDLLFSLRIQPRFKLVNFNINLPPELPNAEIDVGQIQQVLINLLNNAADAIGERVAHLGDPHEDFHRQISITAGFDKTADQVFVEVSDNGSGMPKEVLDRIFTLHFSTKKGGHGLGLYNCRKIVEQHGGKLEVSSIAGEGTTFRLVLPRIHQTVQA